MSTIPTGTPVVITVRGKTVPGTVKGYVTTTKGPFIEMQDGRKARPACVTVKAAEVAPTTESVADLLG